MLRVRVARREGNAYDYAPDACPFHNLLDDFGG